MGGQSDSEESDAASSNTNGGEVAEPLNEQLVPAEFTTVGVNGWSTDVLKSTIVLSPGINRLFGLPDDAEVPTTIAELRKRYHPDDVDRVAAETNAALADPSRGFYRNNFRAVRPDGSIAWVEARGVIYRDGDGRAVRTVGLMLDITDLKERELVLEESRQRLEAALTDAAITLFQQDQALRYTWVHNPSAGFDKEALIGKTDAELMAAESAAGLTALKQKVLDTGRSLRQEVLVEHRGVSARFDLHLEPLRDAAGTVVGLTGAAIALNGRRNAAAEERSSARRDLLLDKLVGHTPRSPDGKPSVSRGTAALVRKLAAISELTDADMQRLAALEQRQQLVPARVALVDGETNGQPPVVIASGWAHSYQLLADGSRQIINFHLPGDLLGNNFGVVPVAGTVAATLTDCLVGRVDGSLFEQIRRSPGRLAEALHWASAREKAIIQQHLVSTGRRSALAGLAHLLLELGERLKTVLLAEDSGFRCPLTQEHLADALGLTPIHVNRMLRELRQMDALTFRRGFVHFHDRDKLVRLAEYEPGFLDPLRNKRQVAPPSLT
jgi:PAS domain S-box-containing protein